MDFRHKIGINTNLLTSLQILNPTNGESPGSFPMLILPKIAQNRHFCDMTTFDQPERMFKHYVWTLGTR